MENGKVNSVSATDVQKLKFSVEINVRSRCASKWNKLL